jgi:hypothetical protein
MKHILMGVLEYDRRKPIRQKQCLGCLAPIRVGSNAKRCFECAEIERVRLRHQNRKRLRQRRKDEKAKGVGS